MDGPDIPPGAKSTEEAGVAIFWSFGHWTTSASIKNFWLTNILYYEICGIVSIKDIPEQIYSLLLSNPK